MMETKLLQEFKGKGETKGFTFTRIDETETAYAYVVNTGESTHYEVFEKRTVPLCIDFENRVYSETDTKEIYLKSNDFGVWAWTTNSWLRTETICRNI